MRRYALVAISLFAALPAIAELRYNQENTPDWVTPVEIPSQWSSEPAVAELAGQATHYKLVDQQTYIDSSLEYHRFRHYVERPLTQDGLQSSGAIEVLFKPDFQRVTLHHLIIIRNGVATDRLAQARVSVVDVEPESDRNLYGGQSKILILVPDYRLGDTLDYQYTITGRNPVLGKKFTPSFSLGWGVPVERVYRQLTVPTTSEIQFLSENIDVRPTITDTQFGRSYSLQLEKTPSYHPDPNAPSFSNIYPYLSFSEFDTWQDVRQWATPLFQYATPTNDPTWQLWLQEIQQQPTVEQKITYALNLVQDNIRYVGIEIGENSHRPHPPSETLALAYGDCKDKTLLLVSLLQAANIPAEPFLVNTDSTAALKDWLPTASAFDHVITRVSVDGQHYYVDPTLSYQGGSHLKDLGYYSYEFGLPVYSDEGLTPMPLQQITRPHVNTNQVFQSYDYTLPVLLTTTTEYYQQQADYQRYRYANNTATEIERGYIDYYTREYGKTTIAKNLSFQDNRDDNVFSVSLQLWINNFYQYDSQENKFEYDIFAYLPQDYLTVPERINRTQPYYVGAPTYISQTMAVKHPTTYDATALKPNLAEFENETFNFKVTTFELPDQSRYSFYYRNFKDSVSAEHIEQYTDDIRAARSHLNYTGWFNNVIAPEKNTTARDFFGRLISNHPSMEASF